MFSGNDCGYLMKEKPASHCTNKDFINLSNIFRFAPIQSEDLLTWFTINRLSTGSIKMPFEIVSKSRALQFSSIMNMHTHTNNRGHKTSSHQQQSRKHVCLMRSFPNELLMITIGDYHC